MPISRRHLHVETWVTVGARRHVIHAVLTIFRSRQERHQPLAELGELRQRGS
jgi:hypothetical protein